MTEGCSSLRRMALSQSWMTFFFLPSYFRSPLAELAERARVTRCLRRCFHLQPSPEPNH